MFTCFNPCFTGSPTLTEFNGECRTIASLFQSLFYWKSYSNMATNLSMKYQRGFNPCFTGSPTLTPILNYKKLIEDYGFNPCFTGSPTLTKGF